MVFMKDEDFEKIMDAWAAHEVEPSPRGKRAKKGPELRPTEEMYRMIEARKTKELFPVHARLILVGTVVICLALLMIILPSVFFLSDRDHGPSIGLREISVPEEGVIVKHPPKHRGKGPEKGPMFFHQLMFHYQKADSQSAYGVDIRFPQEEKLTLTADDNYRLLMELASECYVYIYQLDCLGELIKLFPNDVYSSVQNPLQQGQTYYIPSDPNWFHLGEKEGEEQIYVVASAQVISKLEELSAKYDETGNRSMRQEFLSRLLKELDGELSGEDITIWRFAFSHR
jgi:hypothetical protein